MPYATPGRQGINGAELHAQTPAIVVQLRRVYVILAIRHQLRQGTETINDILARAWPGETLQQFLQNHVGRDNSVSTFKRLTQGKHCGGARSRIPPERQ